MRGGTTSLAEAKLYKIPLIIVPLPVTHDQHTNALYYQKIYMDIICPQCPLLYKELTKHILTTKKKDIYYPDIKSIQKAKEIIYNAII